jgi:hypothetical protein
MARVTLIAIRALMLHKSYQMTLRYVHLHPDHLRGATDVLNVVSSPSGPELAYEIKKGGLRLVSRSL